MGDRTTFPVSASTEDPNAVRICLDTETPIVEVGGENPELWDIWDLMAGNCAVELGSQLCFDCGDDLPWQPVVPMPGDPEGEAGDVEAAGMGSAAARAEHAGIPARLPFIGSGRPVCGSLAGVESGDWPGRCAGGRSPKEPVEGRGR